jgi:hypothetical protein
MLKGIIKKYNFFIIYNRLINSLNNKNFFCHLLTVISNKNYSHFVSLLSNQSSQLNYNQNKQTYIFINNKLSRRNPAKIIYERCFLFLQGACFGS